MPCNDLDFMFRRETVGTLDSPVNVIVQSIPTLVALIVWVGLEVSPKRRQTSPVVTAFTYGISFLSVALLGVMTQRTLDKLDCDGYDTGGGFRLLVVGVPLTATLITLLCKHSPRLFAFLSILLSSSAIVLNYLFRVEISEAASHTFSTIQHVYCILTVVSVTYLPVKRRSRPIMYAIDPLNRSKEGETACNTNRHSSWF